MGRDPCEKWVEIRDLYLDSGEIDGPMFYYVGSLPLNISELWIM